jgi:hypothetical protein
MGAFRKVVSEHFGYSRSEIVRDVSRCRQTRSEHCECGACDFFTTDLLKGRLLFDWLGKHADALGVQSIIFNRRVRGFGNPSERHYTGPSPHTDHVHAGLNRWARQNLTEAGIRTLLPGQPPQEDFLAKLTEDEQQELLAKVRQIWKASGDVENGVYTGVLEDVDRLGARLTGIEEALARLEARP